MIVITGMQRSGTSLMAKFFSQCGYDLGTDFWDDRINGGLENPDVCNFYRDLVGDSSFPFTKYWDMAGQNTFQSFAELDTQIVKFSYLLMRPEFVQQWVYSRGAKRDKMIIMWRDVASIYKSKTSRPEFFNEDWRYLRLTMAELEQNRQASMKILTSHGFDILVVPFPNCREHISMIEKFVDLPLPLKIWDNLFDKTEIHF